MLTLLQEVVTAVRTVRAELGVPPSRRLRLQIEAADAGERTVLDGHGDYVRRLAGLESFEFVESAPADPDSVRRIVRRMRLYLPLSGIIESGGGDGPAAPRDRQDLEAARLAGRQARQPEVPGARRPGGGGRDRGPPRGGAAAPAAARRGAGGAGAVTAGAMTAAVVAGAASPVAAGLGARVGRPVSGPPPAPYAARLGDAALPTRAVRGAGASPFAGRLDQRRRRGPRRGRRAARHGGGGGRADGRPGTPREPLVLTPPAPACTCRCCCAPPLPPC